MKPLKIAALAFFLAAGAAPAFAIIADDNGCGCICIKPWCCWGMPI